MRESSAASVRPDADIPHPHISPPGVALQGIGGASRWSRLRRGLRRRLMSPQSRQRRLANVILLVGGLGLGQGSLFVCQSLLIARGQYELLAQFGLHYALAGLGIMLVDAGAVTSLARMMARHYTEPHAHQQVWRTFAETSVIRAAIAVVIAAGAIVYGVLIADHGFSKSYVMLAVPGSTLWAVNGTGLLDGLRLSGVSGLAAALPAIATAVGLLAAASLPADTAGAVLGSAFSAGYAVTLLLQWSVLGRNGWSPRWARVTRTGVATAARDAVALLFQLLPGQLFGRGQILLSASFLGAETTALFVYAKQIVSALTQVVAFVLRVEFPNLVETLARTGPRTLQRILAPQMAALGCALVLACGMLAAAAIVDRLPSLGLHRTAIVLALFAPTVLTVSLSLVVMQGLAALGAYRLMAWSLAGSAAAGMVVAALTIPWLGIGALVVGEVAFHLIGFYVIARRGFGRSHPG
ncbi:lipopolysaccharide biosynthesis protein [Bradyrhizobium sp. HKCCYLS3077]|uniref:lipopolysaccharide biosynthesis protein n=1 Tax=Bradyrhizobium sp. HKCCYLS3077 TaxID=3420761 RepID=UPI003EBDA572